MRYLLLILFVLGPLNSFSKCGDDKLTKEVLKSFFVPGSLSSNVFLDVYLDKKVRRCNEFSGCEGWSRAKATIRFRDILNSMDDYFSFMNFPSRAEVFFVVNDQGKAQLKLNFWEADVTAHVNFSINSSKIQLKSSSYRRTYGSHSPPVPYVSYYNEEVASPFDLNGHIGQNCFSLQSRFKVAKNDFQYDEYDISLKNK